MGWSPAGEKAQALLGGGSEFGRIGEDALSGVAGEVEGFVGEGELSDHWVVETLLEIVGPRCFGYDFDYRPFENARV